MKSQTLVIDLIRNWLPSSDRDNYIHKALEYFDIAVVSYDPDYPGTEKAEVKIIWDHVEALGDPKRVELSKAISDVTKRFEVIIGTHCVAISHEGAVTHMSFKNTEFKQIENFDWLKLELKPKEPL